MFKVNDASHCFAGAGWMLAELPHHRVEPCPNGRGAALGWVTATNGLIKSSCVYVRRCILTNRNHPRWTFTTSLWLTVKFNNIRDQLVAHKFTFQEAQKLTRSDDWDPPLEHLPEHRTDRGNFLCFLTQQKPRDKRGCWREPLRPLRPGRAAVTWCCWLPTLILCIKIE